MLIDTDGPVLVLAAHPDDEVLGCGGLLSRWERERRLRECVFVSFFTDGVGSRESASMGADASRRDHAAIIAKRFGFEIISGGPHSFSDNALDALPRLALAQVVEQILKHVKPRVVLTHHPYDLNVDHRRVYEAAMIATRPEPGQCVREIYAFEVLSSTEWGSVAFRPNVFVDISETLLDKMNAMTVYEFEAREPPHARSSVAIEALARLRGCSVGMRAAEAFELVRYLER